MEPTQSSSLDFEILSACGPIRSENQDACLAWLSEGGALGLIVSDGMGGHAAGREAAEIVVRICLRALRERETSASWQEVLATGLDLAQAAVLAAQDNLGTTGMGATVVIALLEPSAMGYCLYLAHVGDSRVYLLRGRSLYRLTHDHSLVAQMVRDGLISEEEALGHPDSNVLQRALGQRAPLLPEIQDPAPLEGGDLLLVCSDGLHGSVPEPEICRIACGGLDARATVDALLAAALESGSTDNITIGCCRILPKGGKRRPTRVP